MNKQHQDISKLLQKYLREEISTEELLIIQQWAAQSSANRKVWDSVSDTDSLLSDLRDFQSIKADSKSTLDYVLSQAEPTAAVPTEKNITPTRHLHLLRWLPYVAALLLISGLFAAYYFEQQSALQDLPPALETASKAENPNAPREGVKISFSDGNSVTLDRDKEAIQMLDKHIYYENGSGVLSAKAYRYLTVSVPKGEQFQVTLSDGSTVLLNAGSSLRYPVSFDGKARKVSLQGEGYFAITRQESKDFSGGLVPFIVDMGDKQVQVHGTQFNVNNYPSEKQTKVTLVDGKVSIHGNGEQLKEGVFLSPGQQAELTGNRAEVKRVNLHDELAWKDGLFNFEGKGLYEIMDELARWYNVEVLYRDHVPDIPFFGKAHRSEPLLSILQLLKSADITYRLTSYDDERPARLEILAKHKQTIKK